MGGGTNDITLKGAIIIKNKYNKREGDTEERELLFSFHERKNLLRLEISESHSAIVLYTYVVLSAEVF
jgi:hypothetical protein